nr:adenine nucleotide transporter BT1, chloroplastic/mitochondrial-like [Ipomoea trifida]
MGRRRLRDFGEKEDGLFLNSGIGFLWCPQDEGYHPGGYFASMWQMGMGFGISHSLQSSSENLPRLNVFGQYKAPDASLKESRFPELAGTEAVEVKEQWGQKKQKKKGVGLRWRVKVGNPSLRRLISGAIAGAVSRTSVAPLETIRTHMMVGNYGHSTNEVFQNIMKNEGWKGLFSGNLVNVIRVAPSKAIELFVYETFKKRLTAKPDEQPRLPGPASLISGAVAGISSTLCTYPLELLKTRLTLQTGVYKNVLDALVKIVKEEGPAELYRGLTPSLIGVIPYAATNYYAYDTLRKAYRQILKQEEIGNMATLLIGSAAGAISGGVTFPLEVARKHMQAGALNGRQYHNMLHALISILEHEGVLGLYRGLGPSCLKLVPAAGISFMCYEACKKILVEHENAD